MSDKAHFHLLDTVNKQNFHYWADSNPQQLHQHPVHSPQVNVWCGVASSGIVAPPPPSFIFIFLLLFFYVEKECGQAVTITSSQYVEM